MSLTPGWDEEDAQSCSGRKMDNEGSLPQQAGAVRRVKLRHRVPGTTPLYGGIVSRRRTGENVERNARQQLEPWISSAWHSHNRGNGVLRETHKASW
ncbi:hypothetical protein NDU88_000824 [Pleurodeles waltl]|uniref:Uncharacterized protein n=1 Tax=Pleurodeles waltl TaxID=8319 RepID=A0AAV7L806_PLEWA|nr:hypothetical protein NDU88_000824 [Pleurodeles waltl]